MVPADIQEYVDKLRARGKELEQELADPGIYADAARARRVTGEHRKLQNLFDSFDEWVNSLKSIGDSHEMLATEEDSEMRELIEQEMESLKVRATELEESIQIALLPPDPNDAKNIIVEVKPAAGGDEAALFAGEMCRVYLHFAEKQGWKAEILEHSATDLGGVKAMSFSLSGNDV